MWCVVKVIFISKYIFSAASPLNHKRFFHFRLFSHLFRPKNVRHICPVFTFTLITKFSHFYITFSHNKLVFFLYLIGWGLAIILRFLFLSKFSYLIFLIICTIRLKTTHVRVVTFEYAVMKIFPQVLQGTQFVFTHRQLDYFLLM